jgi:glycerol kinase
MKFFDKVSESEKMILSSDDNDGDILFLPAFNGLGAPYWNSSIRGGFYGITQDTRREEMVTAAFESICFQVLDIIKILEDYKISSDELRVDGGMIANDVFCQLLSDSLNKEIVSPKNIESTALGACIVAMIGSGAIKDFNDVNIKKSFESSIATNTKLLKKYDKWKRYINNSLS